MRVFPPHHPIIYARSSLSLSLSPLLCQELKESSDVGIEQLKQAGEKAYDQACDFCHNWRHYPKVRRTQEEGRESGHLIGCVLCVS